MAGQHGGYRQPANPAPVSNPGAGSARTDGGPTKMRLPNAQYGEGADFASIQGGAPLSGPMGGASPSAPAGPPRPTPAGLGDPSAQPDQPVTHGADAGPGAGMDSLRLPDSSNEVADLKNRYGSMIPVLIAHAEDPHTSQQFRDQLRYVLSKIS